MADIDEKTSRFECGSEGSLNEDSGGCGARGDCHGESSCGESSGSGVCENSCANESEESSLAVVAEGGCGGSIVTVSVVGAAALLALAGTAFVLFKKKDA